MDKICNNGLKLKVSSESSTARVFCLECFTRRNLIKAKNCMSMVVEYSSVTDPFIVPIVFLCRKLLSLYKNYEWSQRKKIIAKKKKTLFFIIAAKFAFYHFKCFLVSNIQNVAGTKSCKTYFIASQPFKPGLIII